MTDNVAISAARRGLKFKPSPLLAARLAVSVLCVLVWLAGSQSYPDLIASPSQTFWRVVELIQNRKIIEMVGVTAYEAGVGLAIGAGLGIVLPFLVNMSARLREVVVPFARAAVGIPKLALSPILILWLGIGLGAKVALVALMTFFLVFVATLAGIQSVGRNLVIAVAVFGAGKVEIAKEVLWNSVQPFIWAALRSALPWAINAALVGEFLAAENGLGHYIHHSYNSADIIGVYAGIAVVVALVLLADAVLMIIQKRFLAWRPVDRDMVLH